MKLLLRSAAILLVLIAAFLIYAVIAALTSDEGARAGVAIAYTAGAIVLAFLAAKLWRARDAQPGTA